MGVDDAVDVDGRAARGLEGAQEPPQRQASSGLYLAAYGQGGGHDGQRASMGVTGAVVGRAAKSCLDIRNAFWMRQNWL